MDSSRAFLAHIVDYAGLFPPASLDMTAAVREFNQYLSSDDADLLGRFVVRSSQLEDLRSALSEIPLDERRPWRLSVIAGPDFGSARDAIDNFNSSMTDDVKCDSVELPVRDIDEIDSAMNFFGAQFELFIEVPVRDDPAALISAIASTGASAKIRTGGVIPSAFPSSREILRFLKACVSDRVPFKATAGLHHAVRGNYPLTYEPKSEKAIMHGYLNVFLASAFCCAGADETALAVLDEEDSSAFRFDDSSACWRHACISSAELNRVRAEVARSFGSCSFNEPVGEARQLKII